MMNEAADASVALLPRMMSRSQRSKQEPANHGSTDTVARHLTLECNIPIPEEQAHVEIPKDVQELLQVAACLDSLNHALVRAALLSPNTDTSIAHVYDQAVKLGLVTKLPAGYAFLNAEIQESACALIPKETRAQYHLELGRNLARNLTKTELGTHVKIVIRQFQQGSSEMTSRKERHAVALLCHEAAQLEIAQSNFEQAHVHLMFGMSLLHDKDESPWKSHYSTFLAIYNAAIEVTCCLAKIEEMNDLVDVVLLKATCFYDTLVARSTRVYSLGGRGNTLQAVQEGMWILQQLGISFPKKANKYHVVMELLKTKKLLGTRTNESILRMPVTHDETVLAAMQMLNLVFPNVFKTDPYLAFLVSSKMVQLSLQHGLSAISSVAFSMFGTMHCAFTSHVQQGYRFGQVGLALLERFSSREWLPRVYFGIYGNINRHLCRMQDLIQPLHQGYTVGMETGDVEFAMLNASLHVALMLFGGTPLEVLEKQALEYIVVMESHQQVSAVVKTKSILQFVQNLLGKTDDALHFHSDVFDDSIASPRANNLLLVWCHFQRMILKYLLSDYQGAEQEAVSFRSLRKYLHFKSSFGFILLLEGLALLAVCNERPWNVRRQHLAVVRVNIKQLEKEALMNPEDVAGKVFLLQGELARIKGKKDVARHKFVCAVAVTRDSGVLLDHAVACERASRFIRSIGENKAAIQYLQQASKSFGEWGARIKVEQLEKELKETSGAPTAALD